MTTLGKKYSVKSRARLSEALRRRWANSEQRRDLLASYDRRSARPEYHAKLSSARKRHLENADPNCACMVCSPRFRGVETSIEIKLFEILQPIFPDVQREVRFGRWRVDAFVPSLNLAFEADGDYWHKLTERDRPGYYAKRDAAILARFGVVTVRLTETELNSVF